jgi:hypothetical protein
MRSRKLPALARFADLIQSMPPGAHARNHPDVCRRCR